MFENKTEEQAKKEILDMVAEYCDTFHNKKKEFEPGDRITYASRVYDHEEMCNLVDSALEFWLTSGRYTDEFEKAFPGKILENKRVYYDDIYDQDDSIAYIKDVHFERENDRYLSGLEYLSSIILLSRCSALVGGNCGGTLGALFFNDEQYQFVHVFDLGLYP